MDADKSLPPTVQTPSKVRRSPWPLVLAIAGTMILGLTISACCVMGGFGFLGAVFFGVSSVFTSSEPYQVSLQRAQDDAQVQQLLGTPLKAGILVTGTLDNTSAGSCDMQIPISGPQGQGTIVVRGTRSGEAWSYEEMRVTIGDRTIDLLPLSIE